MKLYSVKIKRNIYYVIEYIGVRPNEIELFKIYTLSRFANAASKAKATVDEWMSRKRRTLAAMIPTLESDSLYWESMIGKVFSEDEFEIKIDGWQPSYYDPDNIGCLPNGEPIAIPKTQ